MLLRRGSKLLVATGGCCRCATLQLPATAHHFAVQINLTYLKRNYSTPTEVAVKNYPDILDRISVFEKMADSDTVHGLQSFFTLLHDSTGMPWWLTIISATFLLRIALLPLTIHQHQSLARLNNLKPEMDERASVVRIEIASAARKHKWDGATAKKKFVEAIRNEKKELILRDNCHPVKTQISVLMQMPIWIGTSLALRNMAVGLPLDHPGSQLIVQQLSCEGLAWIPNLTDVDHSLILPIGLGLSSLLMSEVFALIRPMELNTAQKFVKWVYRGFSLVIIPLAAYAPADVLLYWTASNVMGLGQNLLLLAPRFRRLVRIPETETELKHPFRKLADNIRQLILRKSNKS